MVSAALLENPQQRQQPRSCRTEEDSAGHLGCLLLSCASPSRVPLAPAPLRGCVLLSATVSAHGRDISRQRTVDGSGERGAAAEISRGPAWARRIPHGLRAN